MKFCPECGTKMKDLNFVQIVVISLILEFE